MSTFSAKERSGESTFQRVLSKDARNRKELLPLDMYGKGMDTFKAG